WEDVAGDAAGLVHDAGDVSAGGDDADLAGPGVDDLFEGLDGVFRCADGPVVPDDGGVVTAARIAEGGDGVLHRLLPGLAEEDVLVEAPGEVVEGASGFGR